MTTDVTNVQNAFQMITRIAVRSPLTLIFSMIAAFVINPELAGVFLIPLVLLGVVLGLIIKRATHLFDQVFKKYDDLNASVQENVSGIRVVKAFVREDFEDKKFGKSGDERLQPVRQGGTHHRFQQPRHDADHLRLGDGAELAGRVAGHGRFA